MSGPRPTPCATLYVPGVQSRFVRTINKQIKFPIENNKRRRYTEKLSLRAFGKTGGKCVPDINERYDNGGVPSIADICYGKTILSELKKSYFIINNYNKKKVKAYILYLFKYLVKEKNLVKTPTMSIDFYPTLYIINVSGALFLRTYNAICIS